MKKLKIGKIDLVLLIVTILWGTNPMIMKVGLRYIEPLPYNTIRLIIAAIFAIAVLKFSKRYKKFEKEDFKILFFVSIFGYGIYQLLFTFGVNMTTAGNGALLMATLPLYIAIINKIFKIEDITLFMVLGIILSMIGVAVIILGSGEEIALSKENILGGVLVLIAVFCYAYYTVFSKKLLNKYSSYQTTAYIMALSSFLFLLISLKEMILMDWASIPAVGWISSIYSAIFAMYLGNAAWVWAIGKIGSTKTSLYNNLTPVFGVLSGCFILGESFGLVQFAGAFIVFLGLYLTKNKTSEIKINIEKNGDIDANS